MQILVRATIVVCLGTMAFLVVACSESPSGPDLVTISGIVRSIDTGEPAAGIRVSLLDTDYADEVETGDDGAYSLKVPRGSVLYLYSDDFNAATDDWFPLVNVDVPGVVANDDMLDFAIHCCPQTLDPGAGSVERWIAHLGSYDDAHEDRFVPVHPAEASGIVASITWLWSSATPDEWVSSEGLALNIPSDAFPEGFVDWAKWVDPADPVDFIYPSSRTTDDGSGLFFSFGDPSFGGTSLEIEVSDPDMVGGRDFASPFSIPVRPGVMSLTHLVAIDGVTGYSFDELFDASPLLGGKTGRALGVAGK